MSVPSILPPKEEVEKFQRDVEELGKKLADETGIKHLVEGIRKLYYEYGLNGEISVTKGALMTESILTCEINGSEGTFVPDEPLAVKVHSIVDTIALALINTMVTGVDKMLKDMIFRSKVYWDRSYKDDLTLAGTFSVSDPKGYFTWTIGCSATIQSMHAYLYRNNEFELTYGFTPDGKSVKP